MDEADIGQVKVGQEVEFTVDAYPELSFRGKVDEIRLAPSTSDNVVSYTVIVEVGNPDLKLMPGMTANVSIISDKKIGVFKVASSALKFQPPASLVEMKEGTGTAEGAQPEKLRKAKMGRTGGTAGSSSQGALWVYENGRIKALRVRLGISDGMYTEVSGNLSDGLEVVTAVTGAPGTKKGGSPFGFGTRR